MDAFPSESVLRVHKRDLVIKVKYGDTSKRFNAWVYGSLFNHDLPDLRLKIASAFKFSPDAEFILTYTDEDGDVVMLDDDNDLKDAAINQKLNPLRINVQLKSSNVEATRTKQQATNSKSLRSISLEDQFAQMKSAIDEALKFVPEQVPIVLAELSQDLRSRAASSAQSLAELPDRFAKLIKRSSSMRPSCGSAGGSASEPSDGQNYGIPKAALKDVVSGDSTAKIERAPSCPLVKDSLGFTSSGGMKYDLKRSLDSEGCSKGKSSVPPVSTRSPGAPQESGTCPLSPVVYPPIPSFALGDLHSTFPPPPNIYTTFPPSPNIYTTFPPPPNIYSPFKLNTPSSTGSSRTDRMASLFSSYLPDQEGINSFGSSYRVLGTNYGSIPQHAQHRWIQCDGCGVTPIVGPRYKSNVKENYDLCGACFTHMGNEAEYTRLDRLASTSNMIFEQIPASKIDSRFIKDVTVLDGTPMAPSTPFTKIWRMCNNGSTMWPYGIQLVWVGGDHLTCLSSALLAANWGLNPCEETDVTIDFLAPAKPGRYISYWRLALPSGLKFGQRIWVHIQVEQLIQTGGDKHGAALDLNQLPEANSTGPFTFDRNSAPVKTLRGWPFTFDINSGHVVEHLRGWPRSTRLAHGTMEPKESEPAPSDMSSIPVAVEPVQTPVTDAPASHAIMASMLAGVPAPEAIFLPNPVPVPAPVSMPAPVGVHVPVTAPATVPEEVVNHLEEKLMGELEVLGFMQAELNKQILRQNKYDLEQSVVDLCGFNERDPLLEFSDLGSDDAEMNGEEVVEEGFIVTDLVTKDKKDH